jgi:hypothetical protein
MKSVVDKLILAATGIGLVFLGVDAIRNRRQAESEDQYYCPYCHTLYPMSSDDFAVHVTQERRRGFR